MLQRPIEDEEKQNKTKIFFVLILRYCAKLPIFTTFYNCDRNKQYVSIKHTSIILTA